MKYLVVAIKDDSPVSIETIIDDINLQLGLRPELQIEFTQVADDTVAETLIDPQGGIWVNATNEQFVLMYRSENYFGTKAEIIEEYGSVKKAVWF